MSRLKSKEAAKLKLKINFGIILKTNLKKSSKGSFPKKNWTHTHFVHVVIRECTFSKKKLDFLNVFLILKYFSKKLLLTTPLCSGTFWTMKNKHELQYKTNFFWGESQISFLYDCTLRLHQKLKLLIYNWFFGLHWQFNWIFFKKKHPSTSLQDKKD